MQSNTKAWIVFQEENLGGTEHLWDLPALIKLSMKVQKHLTSTLKTASVSFPSRAKLWQSPKLIRRSTKPQNFSRRDEGRKS